MNKRCLVAGFSIVCFQFLVGCASMSEGECKTADWYAVGYEDATRGVPESRLADYRKDCAEHGIQASFPEYQAGHKKGLTVFCTEQKGFQFGEGGLTYHNICPLYLEDDFLRGYEKGKELFSWRSEINSLESEFAEHESDIEEYKRLIDENLTIIISSETTESDRATKLIENERLKDQIAEAEHKMAVTADQLNHAERKLSRLEARYKN